MSESGASESLFGYPSVDGAIRRSTLNMQTVTPHNAAPADALKPHPRKVIVTIDCHPREIQSGRYKVDALKKALGVPEHFVLEEIVCGEFHPLCDDGQTHIEGREHFVSHVRRGGSS